MLEAVIWERARPMKDTENEARPWKRPAESVVALLENAWPSQLCSRTAARAIGVQIGVKALEDRFRRLASAREPMERFRARAIMAIAKSGQMATPPPEMTLWNFFKPAENILVNKGALASKEKALQQGRSARRRQLYEEQREAAQAETPAPQPARPRRPDGSPAAPTPATEAAADGNDEGGEYGGYFPGLQRGGAGGRGRGGAIQMSTKIGVQSLVAECHVPVRDVPKVLVDAAVLLTGEVPAETELNSQSHIADWMNELSAGELYDQIAEFWSVRREFGSSVVLHGAHDGTRRTDRDTGKYGELMQFRMSYFNPRPTVNRAVSFLLSMRFITRDDSGLEMDYSSPQAQKANRATAGKRSGGKGAVKQRPRKR